MAFLEELSNRISGGRRTALIHITQSYAILYGCIGAFCLYGSLPLFFYHFGLSAEKYQLYDTIAMIPWCSRPFVAWISDQYPIGNWHKKNYLIGAIVMLGISTLLTGLGTSPSPSIAAEPSTILAFLVMASASIMVIITLMDAVIAVMVNHFRANSNLFPYAQAFFMIGMAIGGSILGVFSNNKGREVYKVFLMATPMAFGCLWPLIFNPNKAMPGDHTDSVLYASSEHQMSLLADYRENPDNTEDVPRNPKSNFRGLAMTMDEKILAWTLSLASGAIAIIMYFSSTILVPYCLGILIGIVLFTLLFIAYRTNTDYLRVCAFITIRQLFHFEIFGLKNAFYTAGDSCVLDGPNFDMVFYFTGISIIKAIAGAAVSIIYIVWMKKRNTIRKNAIIAIVLEMMGAFGDFVIAKRWNLAIGIPDKLAFVLSEAVLESAADTLMAVTVVVYILDKLHNAATITTMLSNIAAFQYYGQTMASMSGIILAKLTNTHANAEYGCNMDGYPFMIGLGTIVMPILTIAFAHILVPDTFAV